MKSLKEWAGVVRALGDGSQSILLRKGGLLDTPSGFQIVSDKFLLFPTFEHQQSTFVKPQFSHYLDTTNPNEGKISITLCAKVVSHADITQVQALAFSDFHIWSDEFVNMRAKWKPENLFKVLLLRVYRITPVIIPYLPEYKGCRSWINIENHFDDQIPIINDDSFNELYTKFVSLIP
ncbi:MAG: DUF1802 family protein [Candidatus Nitrosoabyssus spongiisocia]|nr:MAG: DUF1802 family protein [Nitrosopumilaceae archaeon AB1(1)]